MKIFLSLGAALSAVGIAHGWWTRYQLLSWLASHPQPRHGLNTAHSH